MQKKILFVILFFAIVFFKIAIIFSISHKLDESLINHSSSSINSSTNIIKAKKTDYKLIREHSHSDQIFVQGTEFINDDLYESGGIYGRSGIYINEIDPPKTRKVTDVDYNTFAEGITYLKNYLYQLTWKEKKILIYSLNNIAKPIAEIPWNGEGWGMTNDGENIIISDGTDRIYFLKVEYDENGIPVNYLIAKTINVTWDGDRVKNINELEWIDGKIWANVWMTNNIIVINPETGIVEKYLDLGKLAQSIGVAENEKEKVLNGIARNPSTGNVFLTGKFWPIMFEIKVAE